jgi:hypothetical protein
MTIVAEFKTAYINYKERIATDNNNMISDHIKRLPLYSLKFNFQNQTTTNIIFELRRDNSNLLAKLTIRKNPTQMNRGAFKVTN